jgi:hypothetical protein
MAGPRNRRPALPCPVEAYARDAVEGGRVVVGQLVKLACQRHFADLAAAVNAG